MKKSLVYTFIFMTVLFSSCNTHVAKSSFKNSEQITAINLPFLINHKGVDINQRFQAPEGYHRETTSNSFAKFLNGIGLKKHKCKVYTFDSIQKENPNIYVAVLDLAPLKGNVQFNANAIIRLRAEHAYHEKKYNAINVIPHIKSFNEFNKGDNSYKKFIDYMSYSLTEAIPSTLKNQLKPVPLNDLQIGDIFYQNGPLKSHAVIVVDLAKNDQGQTLFLLAQSSYPGQDIQIISNPTNEFISPWYESNKGVLLTPEWRFSTNDLKRFK